MVSCRWWPGEEYGFCENPLHGLNMFYTREMSMCRWFTRRRGSLQGHVMACSMLLCGLMSSCSMPWERGIGDACDEMIPHRDTSCSEGVCVIDTCQPFVEEGEPCKGVQQCVDKSLICRTMDASVESTSLYCLPQRQEGDACVEGRFECDYTGNLNCFKGVCSPPGERGEPCRLWTTSVPVCQEGLTCTTGEPERYPLTSEEFEMLDRNGGQCLVGGGEGEGCDRRRAIGCAPGLDCVENTCIRE